MVHSGFGPNEGEPFYCFQILQKNVLNTLHCFLRRFWPGKIGRQNKGPCSASRAKVSACSSGKLKNLACASLVSAPLLSLSCPTSVHSQVHEQNEYTEQIVETCCASGAQAYSLGQPYHVLFLASIVIRKLPTETFHLTKTLVSCSATMTLGPLVFCQAAQRIRVCFE